MLGRLCREAPHALWRAQCVASLGGVRRAHVQTIIFDDADAAASQERRWSAQRLMFRKAFEKPILSPLLSLRSEQEASVKQEKRTARERVKALNTPRRKFLSERDRTYQRRRDTHKGFVKKFTREDFPFYTPNLDEASENPTGRLKKLLKKYPFKTRLLRGLFVQFNHLTRPQFDLKLANALTATLVKDHHLDLGSVEFDYGIVSELKSDQMDIVYDRYRAEHLLFMGLEYGMMIKKALKKRVLADFPSIEPDIADTRERFKKVHLEQDLKDPERQDMMGDSRDEDELPEMSKNPEVMFERRCYFTPQYIKSTKLEERKVVLRVRTDVLNLPSVVRERLQELAGPRFDPEQDVITLKCSRFPHKHDNTVMAMRWLRSLMEESFAVYGGYTPHTDVGKEPQEVAAPLGLELSNITLQAKGGREVESGEEGARLNMFRFHSFDDAEAKTALVARLEAELSRLDNESTV